MFTKKIFTPEIIEFIKNNAIGISSKDLAILVNKEFNTDFTGEQIRGCKSNHKIKSGYRRSKGMNKPVPIGTEEIHNGYLRVKIGNPSVWRNKGIIVWEKVHGKIPKDHRIAYLDGNPANADINNLCLISRADQARLTRFGKNNGNVELQQTKINLVKLKAAVKEKKKQNNRNHI